MNFVKVTDHKGNELSTINSKGDLCVLLSQAIKAACKAVSETRRSQTIRGHNTDGVCVAYRFVDLDCND